MIIEINDKPIDFEIKKIKDISFFINETLFVKDPSKQIKIELSQIFGTNLQSNLVNFTVRIYLHYQDALPENILADIHVQNIYFVSDLANYATNEIITLPAEILVTLVGMSIAHARALFAKNIAGTVLQEIVLPAVNVIDITNYFFPTANLTSPPNSNVVESNNSPLNQALKIK